MNRPANPRLSLFMGQQSRFTEALKNHEPGVWFPPLRGRMTEDSPGNWFICFVPSSWGRWQGSVYGVHFEFLYARERGSLPERIRLSVGVETPMKDPFKPEFKETVISRVRAAGIAEAGFVLQNRPRTKLLEPDPIPFNSHSWQNALERYVALQPVVSIIGQVLKEFDSRGAFKVPLAF